jgi:hypothetical protein
LKQQEKQQKKGNKTMSTTAITKTPATPPAKPGVMNALAAKLDCDPAKLLPMLKKTAFATCKTDEEFMAMCMVANTYNLNPILKEVYAFPSKGGAVVPIVGVDGWIKIMNSHPQFDGIEFEETNDACTARIYRKDRAHPISATEWLAECVGTTEPWKRWPRRMLRHKAMIQCARLAFGFAGIYDEDEGRRIAEAHEAEIIAAAEPPKAEKKALRGALGIATEPEIASEAAETPQESELALG